MGFILLILSRTMGIVFNDNKWVILLCITIGMIFAILGLKRIRDEYIKVLKELRSNWTDLAIVSIFVYIMCYLIAAYPTPMVVRREYLPVLLFFCVTTGFVYKVIYKTVLRDIRLYNEKREKELLEVQIELKDSQLKLKEAYYQMAYTDSLTGLENRRAFEEKINRINNCKSILCISMDLNNLKETNDLLGHEQGDKLLILFSEILKKIFKGNGNVFRVGGDEFIVFLENAQKDDGNKFTAAIREECKLYKGENEFEVDVAIGSYYSEELSDLKFIINEADGEMYKNKLAIKLERFN